MGRKQWFWGTAAAVALAVPIWALTSMEPAQAPDPERPTAAAERMRKLAVAREDVKMTEQLCRLQCRKDISRAAQQAANAADGQESLRRLREEKRHFLALAHVRGGKIAEVAGDPPESSHAEAKEHWKRAAEAVASGKSYMSEPFRDKDGHTYFILGEPADTDTGVIGFVRQDVLHRVEAHQTRNLRLAEFPDDDARFGIRAVDPATGREQDVDSPEENQGISHYVKREVVVRFKDAPPQRELERMMKETDAVSMNRLGEVYVFTSRSKSTRELLDYFEEKGVEYAEPHYMYVTNEDREDGAVVPNDELYGRYQWNLPAISVPDGWTLSKGTEEVVVAVVDTGVDLSHPDLAGHLTDGYNAIDPDAPPQDDVGHGTHVAGVVGALTDNGEGVAGMTWYNRIMPVKVLDSTGMGSTYSVARGIIWAVDNGAKVINLSLGNYAGASFLHDAIRYAHERDVVLIAATGNDNTDTPGFPAAYPEVFAVSATNREGGLASFSNYGEYIDVVAPGEQIASTYTDSQYAALSGTSMASPHVAALAALIRSANPALTNTEVYDVMRRSAIDLGASGRDAQYGYGLIDAVRALQLATGTAPQEAAGGTGETVAAEPVLERLLKALFGF